MADPRSFLSFDFDNNQAEKELFAGQAKKDSPTPFTLEDWSSKSSLPQAQWEKIIKAKIGKCHFLVVLVGKSMRSASGVKKEISMAQELNVPIFGIYVGGANSKSTLPTGLSRSRTIAWTWDGIGSKITQMMGEGKNAKKG